MKRFIAVCALVVVGVSLSQGGILLTNGFVSAIMSNTAAGAGTAINLHGYYGSVVGVRKDFLQVGNTNDWADLGVNYQTFFEQGSQQPNAQQVGLSFTWQFYNPPKWMKDLLWQPKNVGIGVGVDENVNIIQNVKKYDWKDTTFGLRVSTAIGK